jgi:hypothetical protein
MNGIPIKSLAAVIVKLFALFITIYTLRNLSTIPLYYSDGVFDIVFWIYLSTSILFILLAIILWNFPGFVVNKIISWDIKETPNSKNNAEEFEIVGFSLIGLVYLYYALSDLAYWLFLMWSVHHSHDITGTLSYEQKSNIAITIFEVFFALFIMLRAKGLVGLLRKIRNAGL